MTYETKQPWTPGPWRSDYDEVDAFAHIVSANRVLELCGWRWS